MWLTTWPRSPPRRSAKQLPLEGAPQLAVAAGLDDAADAGGLDLGALTDPDLVREVADGAIEAPQAAITDDTAGQAERSTEAFGATQRQREAVPAAGAAQPATKPARKTAAAPAPVAPKQEALPKVTYAQLADAITKAKNRDDAAMALDEGRGLPDDQRADLATLFHRTWPAEG